LKQKSFDPLQFLQLVKPVVHSQQPIDHTQILEHHNSLFPSLAKKKKINQTKNMSVHTMRLSSATVQSAALCLVAMAALLVSPAASLPLGSRGSLSGTVYVQTRFGRTARKLSLASVRFTSGLTTKSDVSSSDGSYSIGTVGIATWSISASHFSYPGYTVTPGSVFTRGTAQTLDIYLCHPQRLSCGPITTNAPTAAPTPCSPSGNLLANPGAEDGETSDWLAFEWRPQEDGSLWTGSVAFDGITTDSPATGTNAFELSGHWYPGSSYDPETDGDVIHHVYQDVTVPSGASSVRVSGKLWNDIANSGIDGYALIRVEYFDSNGYVYSFMSLTTSETSTETWHSVEQTATLPVSGIATRLRVYLDRGSTSTTSYEGNVARYDDISLEFVCT
jgi:hypothetical protein